MQVHKYRLYCETEAAMKYVWGEAAPTECPDDAGHTIDPDSVSIVSQNPGDDGEQRYYVSTYTSGNNRLQSEIWYHTDNGDGTYSEKVKEILYSYQGNTMTQRVERTFMRDGTQLSEKTFQYYRNGNTVIVKQL